MKDFYIQVLGENWHVMEKDCADDPKMDGCNGYCELMSKEIVISDEIMKDDPTKLKDIESFRNKVVYHELIHAFFTESGLDEYCRDETLVDFLAWQLPKLSKLMHYANKALEL